MYFNPSNHYTSLDFFLVANICLVFLSLHPSFVPPCLPYYSVNSAKMYADNKLNFAASGYMLFLFLRDSLLFGRRLLVSETLKFTVKLGLHACFEKHAV